MSDLKNRIRIGSSVDKILYERFKALSDKTRVPLSRLLDEAIRDILKKYEDFKF